MKGTEKKWKDRTLGELLTPWKAEANYILKKLGAFWYGCEENYGEFLFDPPLFQFHFVASAAYYYLEHGGQRSDFYRRLEKEKASCQEPPPNFPQILHEAYCLAYAGLTPSKGDEFFYEPEIKLIGKMMVNLLNAIYWHGTLLNISGGRVSRPLCHYGGSEEASQVPTWEYFASLRTEPDISIDELEKLMQERHSTAMPSTKER